MGQYRSPRIQLVSYAGGLEENRRWDSVVHRKTLMKYPQRCLKALGQAARRKPMKEAKIVMIRGCNHLSSNTSEFSLFQ
jgi:hypothetical protein